MSIEANDDEVICPNCVHQFRAIPVNVQKELAAAQAEKQEPYGYFRYDIRLDAWVKSRDSNKGVAFYTHPQPKRWIGLTDEEIEQGQKESWVTEQAFQSAVWWADAKLKEKNG